MNIRPVVLKFRGYRRNLCSDSSSRFVELFGLDVALNEIFHCFSQYIQESFGKVL
jgi:hypothetical protein